MYSARYGYVIKIPSHVASNDVAFSITLMLNAKKYGNTLRDNRYDEIFWLVDLKDIFTSSYSLYCEKNLRFTCYQYSTCNIYTCRIYFGAILGLKKNM